MIISTGNRSFVEAEQYSSFILENMHDGMLPSDFYRDVSDFGSGDTLHIKTIGEATIQEVEEDVGITYSPIETGSVTLSITDYIGDGWYVTDKMRQDGAQIDQLLASRGKEATRAIQEHFETRALAVLNAVQTADDNNAINGFNRRYVAGGTNNTMELADFIKMRLAFNKAEVPMAGRVAFVDPVVEATLNLTYSISSGTGDLAANSVWQSITESGFSREHNFVINLYGWNVITSNRLPTIASETIDTVTVTTGVANIFMCIADDHCKPLMAAWRQMPRVEGERNKDLQRDEFVQTARFGLGVQRVDTLGIVLTDATAIA